MPQHRLALRHGPVIRVAGDANRGLTVRPAGNRDAAVGGQQVMVGENPQQGQSAGDVTGTLERNLAQNLEPAC